MRQRPCKVGTSIHIGSEHRHGPELAGLEASEHSPVRAREMGPLTPIDLIGIAMLNSVEPPKIAVCLITRMRDVGLRRALEGIAKQNLPPSDYSHLRVIVIDNDPDGSARCMCDKMRTTFRWKLDYYVEPNVGIPFARNLALSMAMATDDLVVFFDDDEVPLEDWLAQLLRVWRERSADVVFGPVSPYFPESVPEWVIRGHFFERENHQTGSVCSVGATNNVLISVKMLRESRIRFDEEYRFSGGSDWVFFSHVHKAGYRMLWAHEARVSEWIPKSRATVKWLARRHFRFGTLAARQQHLGARVVVIVRAVARIVFGICCAGPFLLLGKHRSVQAIRWASYGLGLLNGALGGHFDEYRSPRPV